MYKYEVKEREKFFLVSHLLFIDLKSFFFS